MTHNDKKIHNGLQRSKNDQKQSKTTHNNPRHSATTSNYARNTRQRRTTIYSHPQQPTTVRIDKRNNQQ